MIQLLQFKPPLGYIFKSLQFDEGLKSTTYQFDLFDKEIQYINRCYNLKISFSLDSVLTNHICAIFNIKYWNTASTNKYVFIDEESKDVISMPSYNCCYKLSNNQQQISLIIL